MASIHQVNHPGKEFEITSNPKKQCPQDFYFLKGSTIKGIRLWNRHKHMRKFIEINGKYVDSLQSSTEKASLLRFWGEYEGHSEFELFSPLQNVFYWNSPMAVHRPFFCNQNINNQNTDPFVFGEEFYYAICKKNNLKNLRSGDIVLFGTEFGKIGNKKFYLDTLFVAKKPQESILKLNLYDLIYQESTLKRIGISDCTNGTLPVHSGVKFSDNFECFSFFPCKPVENNNMLFGRPEIDTIKLGLKKPGAGTGSKSKELSPDENITDIWKNIAEEVIKQGFVLGTHADQLTILKQLP